MNNTKHTPGPSTEDIMMFFDLSDEDWDDLTGRMQDQLRDAYISHTDPVRAAAPAMYEALQQSLVLVELAALEEWGRAVRGEQQPPTTEAKDRLEKVKTALAQAEGQHHE